MGNGMRLYMIRRKTDALFLRKIEGHYSRHVGQDKNAWSETPAYLLRTADGVAMNLRKLCSVPRGKGYEIDWQDFDARKLSLYEVICIDVNVIEMRAVAATDFAQPEAIASIPLTKDERAAA